MYSEATVSSLFTPPSPPPALQNIPLWQKALAGLTAGGLGALVGNPADLTLIRMQVCSGGGGEGGGAWAIQWGFGEAGGWWVGGVSGQYSGVSWGGQVGSTVGLAGGKSLFSRLLSLLPKIILHAPLTSLPFWPPPTPPSGRQLPPRGAEA